MPLFVKIKKKKVKMWWSWYSYPKNGAAQVISKDDKTSTFKVEVLHSGFKNSIRYKDCEIITEQEATEITNTFLKMSLEQRQHYIIKNNHDIK